MHIPRIDFVTVTAFLLAVCSVLPVLSASSLTTQPLAKLTGGPSFRNRGLSPQFINATDPQWAPTRQEMMAIVNNTVHAHRGLKCQYLKEAVICDRIDWFTKGEIRGNETWNMVLTRLVQYQMFQQTIPGDPDKESFTTILDTIRGINDVVSEPGSLVGRSPRVLDALDPVLNDICGQTWHSKVDRRLQEIVDIVQVGLGSSGQPHRDIGDIGTPPPCNCHLENHLGEACDFRASVSWDPVEGWDCECSKTYCVPGKDR